MEFESLIDRCRIATARVIYGNLQPGERGSVAAAGQAKAAGATAEAGRYRAAFDRLQPGQKMGEIKSGTKFIAG